MVEGVKNLKEKMLKEGATLAQHGYFYVQNKPPTTAQGKILLELNNCPQKKVLKNLIVNRIELFDLLVELTKI